MSSGRKQVKAAPGVGWYRRRTIDLDEVAVLRAVQGDHLKLTKTERDTAIDHLDSKGHSAAEVARRIGCNERTVLRRREVRMAAGGPAPAITRQLRHSDETWQRMAELITDGVPPMEISMRLGVGLSTVYFHRNRRVSGQVAA